MQPLSRRAFVAATALALPAYAQAPYPSRPIRLVTPFPPGASTDAVGRITAEKLSSQLGQPVVVDNRAGAGGLIGAQAVAQSAPDGYTLLTATISVGTMVPHMMHNLGWDPTRDLTNIARTAVVPNAILVRAGLPVNDLGGLIELAKTRPGALTYASPGNGTSPHLCAEYLKVQAGIDLVHVPYRGTAPLLADLLAGRVDVAVDNLPFYVPQVRDGRLRLLAVTSPERWFSVPDTPTVSEGALPGFAMIVWWGVQAPRNTSLAVLQRVEAATLAAFNDETTRARLRDLGIDAAPLGTADFNRFAAAEYERWGDVIRRAGIRMD